LRPVRAARSLTKKLPKPVIATLSPADNAEVIALVVASNARAASAFVKPDVSAIDATKSDLFITLFSCFVNHISILKFAKHYKML
jgi:hypothetical protein